tara:strand:+ start:1391 stop:1792 length:402 start_codon:yes stop_codon:yes gene_type:complete
MAIKLGRRLFASVRNLTPGDLISFGYNGKVRTGVVISPDWKENVDCYVFDNPEDMPEELAEHILLTTNVLDHGDLYVDFGNEYEFKSFKRNDMTGIQQIEYLLNEEEVEEETVVEKVIDTVTEVIDNPNLYGE